MQKAAGSRFRQVIIRVSKNIISTSIHMTSLSIIGLSYLGIP
jgi:hypothetical protein